MYALTRTQPTKHSHREGVLLEELPAVGGVLLRAERVRLVRAGLGAALVWRRSEGCVCVCMCEWMGGGGG